jgi:hypothetical protein
MADEQTAGPVEHLITVQCDSTSSTLTLQEPSVALKLGDRVVWQFFGMPDGWSPWIELRSQESGTQFLGPFTGLTQSAAALWGEVRMDDCLVGQTVVYRVSIQRGIGSGWDQGEATVRSAAGALTINPEDHGTLQTFTVEPDGDHTLKVSPIGVIIQPCDTVEWVFQGVADPSSWRPVVSFDHYDGRGDVPNAYLGPFSSLATGGDRIRGTGNNQVAGIYHFKVSVIRISDGAILWMGSSDPAIDNRGGVVDPTGGGTGGKGRQGGH